MANRLRSSLIVQDLSQSDPGESRLWIGKLDGRGIEQIAREPARLRDLHWSPRGELLGLVRGGIEPRPFAMATPTSPPGQTATLHFWTRAGGLSGRLDLRPVRRFAGWCAAGDHLAYVVARRRPRGGQAALVVFAGSRPAGQGHRSDRRRKRRGGRNDQAGFFRAAQSRSRTGRHRRATRCFRSGARSVLRTGRFSHGSSAGGLRSGDPAALLDARTGTLSWMAVSPLEEVQIGHYEQIKRNYAEAWRRYERAQAAAPDPSSTPAD